MNIAVFTPRFLPRFSDHSTGTPDDGSGMFFVVGFAVSVLCVLVYYCVRFAIRMGRAWK